MDNRLKNQTINEVVMLAMRINSLKAKRLYLKNVIHTMSILFSKSDYIKPTREYLSYIIFEIDIELKSRKKRIHKLIAKLFKASNKMFEESPATIIPGTSDIKTGYIRLAEITEDDQIIPNVLLLSTGDILREEQSETQLLMKEYYVDESLFDKLKSYMVLVDELTHYAKVRELKTKKQEDGQAKLVLGNDEIKVLTNI